MNAPEFVKALETCEVKPALDSAMGYAWETHKGHTVKPGQSVPPPVMGAVLCVSEQVRNLLPVERIQLFDELIAEALTNYKVAITTNVQARTIGLIITRTPIIPAPVPDIIF